MIINGHTFKWKTVQAGKPCTDRSFQLNLHDGANVTTVATVTPVFKGFCMIGYVITVDYNGYKFNDGIDFHKNLKITQKHAFSIAERFIETRK